MISDSLVGGFLIGLVQGFGGVDHGLCLLPLMGKDMKSNIIPGVVWGVCHSAGVICICSLLFILELYGLQIVHLTADYIFGLTLIAYGV